MFGAITLTRNNDPNKYGYSGFGIGFDAPSQFLWSESSRGKNVVFVGADMSLTLHVADKCKDLLFLGECPARLR